MSCSWSVSVLASVLVLAGCGGKVVFQEDGGEGGDGGTGAAGPGPGGPGPGGTGTLNSTATGTVATPCEALCSQQPDCFIPGPDCAAQCKGLYVAGCESQMDAFLLCYLESLGPGCDQPDGACFAEQQAVEACQGQSDCVSKACDVDDGYCSCFGQCPGVALEQVCYFTASPGPGDPPPLPIMCDCYLGEGQFIGNCQQDELVCDLPVGCCQYLLLDGE